MTQPKIAIVGAGPGGCTLARLLTLADIPVNVFEGEPSPNYRSQGGSLDLHTSTGLAAIKEAQLFDAFLAHARYDSDLLQLADKNLNIVLRKAGPPAPVSEYKQSRTTLLDQRPEIDRPELRRLLTESLPAGVIRWGKHLSRVEPSNSADGKHALVFADGTIESGFDLVVGADGAWSKVRARIDPDHTQPAYTRVGYFEMAIPDAANVAPTVYAAVSRGSLFAFAEGVKLALQQMGDGSIGVYVFLTRPDERWAEPEVCGFDPYDSAATRKALLDGPFKDWHPTLRETVEKATAKCTPRSLYQLPVGYRWGHRRGLTLLGDAAHVMTPYAGEGVNQALEDAMELAKAIKGALREQRDGDLDMDVLDKAVASFEKDMWPRTEQVARLTNDLLQTWMFTPDTPGSVLAKTTAMHVRYHTPWFVHPFTTAGVHAYFLLRGLVW